MFDKLGLKDNLTIVHSARRGINPSVFYSFAQSANITEKNLAAIIHLHPRTLKNYTANQKKLDPVESEHLLKLIALFVKGEELFGNVNEFNEWLKEESLSIKEKPLSLLNTPGGTDIISEELDKLAHGYAV
jgi:putative toxin-antitoxin system antitoxin component (TIGR02293 family)